MGYAKKMKFFIDMACYFEYCDYLERGLALVGGEFIKVLEEPRFSIVPL